MLCRQPALLTALRQRGPVNTSQYALQTPLSPWREMTACQRIGEGWLASGPREPHVPTLSTKLPFSLTIVRKVCYLVQPVNFSSSNLMLWHQPSYPAQAGWKIITLQLSRPPVRVWMEGSRRSGCSRINGGRGMWVTGEGNGCVSFPVGAVLFGHGGEGSGRSTFYLIGPRSTKPHSVAIPKLHGFPPTHIHWEQRPQTLPLLPQWAFR